LSKSTRQNSLTVSRKQKKVIAERARELFQMSGDNFQEEQALDTAVCVLHALHGTLSPDRLPYNLTSNDHKTA
jgi:hypothetical protein